MDEDEHQIGTPAVGRVGRRLEKVSLEEPAQIIEGGPRSHLTSRTIEVYTDCQVVSRQNYPLFESGDVLFRR